MNTSYCAHQRNPWSLALWRDAAGIPDLATCMEPQMVRSHAAKPITSLHNVDDKLFGWPNRCFLSNCQDDITEAEGMFLSRKSTLLAFQCSIRGSRSQDTASIDSIPRAFDSHIFDTWCMDIWLRTRRKTNFAHHISVLLHAPEFWDGALIQNYQQDSRAHVGTSYL